MPAKWIFDPLKPSGSRTGGVPSSFVFSPELDIFVREVLQNSKDQRIGEKPAIVKFSLIQLHGEKKQAFLRALDWVELVEHIKGTTRRAEMARRLDRAIEDLQANPLILMRVEDSNTHGLTGGEETRTNFNSLCRNLLEPTHRPP
jgi:phosphoribosylanthranilate isomerase